MEANHWSFEVLLSHLASREELTILQAFRTTRSRKRVVRSLPGSLNRMEGTINPRVERIKRVVSNFFHTLEVEFNLQMIDVDNRIRFLIYEAYVTESSVITDGAFRICSMHQRKRWSQYRYSCMFGYHLSAGEWRYKCLSELNRTTRRNSFASFATNTSWTRLVTDGPACLYTTETEYFICHNGHIICGGCNARQKELNSLCPISHQESGYDSVFTLEWSLRFKSILNNGVRVIST